MSQANQQETTVEKNAERSTSRSECKVAQMPVLYAAKSCFSCASSPSRKLDSRERQRKRMMENANAHRRTECQDGMKDVSSYRKRIDVFNLAPAQLAPVCVTCSESASQSASRDRGEWVRGQRRRKDFCAYNTKDCNS